jgi:hypothetical protein
MRLTMFLVICIQLAACAQTPRPQPTPPPTDPASNPYLSDPSIRQAIEDVQRMRTGCPRADEIKIGMSTQRVLSICGKPFTSVETVTAEGKREGWGYVGPNKTYLYFLNGTLIRIQREH